MMAILHAFRPNTTDGLDESRKLQQEDHSCAETRKRLVYEVEGSQIIVREPESVFLCARHPPVSSCWV